MKNLSKFIFLLVFAIVSASCGDKKESVYDEYPADDDSVNRIQEDTDKTEPSSDKDSDNQADEQDKDAENSDEDSNNAVEDEDELENGDSDIIQPDETTDEDTEKPLNCTGFSLDPNDELTGDLRSRTYTIKIADGILGNSNEDILELRIDHVRSEGDPYIADGTYDLATGHNGRNSNYWTCWECISVYQDYTSNNDSKKFYFQNSGTITINKVDSDYNFGGYFSAVLIESKLEGFWSTPIEDGDCVEIETDFEARTLCVPDCSDKENGESDGCGGTCGTCEEEGEDECDSN